MSFNTVVSTDELYRHLSHPDWRVIDCRFSLADTDRGWKAYQQGHVPGSHYAHLDRDLSGRLQPGRTGRHPLPEIEVIARRVSRWGVGPDTQVVVLDDLGGAIAARTWWMLQWLGHEAVAVLDGGWPRWVEEARPVSRAAARPGTAPAGPFVARPRPELLATGTEVDSLRLDPAYRLIDAREAVRFWGESEPIDPVAGHIPGAVSLPFAGNLGPDGGWRSPKELRRIYAPYLGEIPIENVVCYCGSGVTAAHDLLALARAGFGLGRLYAGSWSEWITDPAHPVSTIE